MYNSLFTYEEVQGLLIMGGDHARLISLGFTGDEYDFVIARFMLARIKLDGENNNPSYRSMIEERVDQTADKLSGDQTTKILRALAREFPTYDYW